MEPKDKLFAFKAGQAAALGMNRATVRVGRRFAPSIATRLDAHPTKDAARRAEERRILDLARDVLTQRDPDPTSVNFVTKAVEMFTDQYGYSKTLHEELFRLHEERNRRAREDAPRVRSGGLDSSGLDLNRFLVGTDAPEDKRGPSGRTGRPTRFLKA